MWKSGNGATTRAPVGANKRTIKNVDITLTTIWTKSFQDSNVHQFHTACNQSKCGPSITHLVKCVECMTQHKCGVIDENYIENIAIFMQFMIWIQCFAWNPIILKLLLPSRPLRCTGEDNEGNYGCLALAGTIWSLSPIFFYCYL